MEQGMSGIWQDRDHLHRFLFDDLGVRGELVYLDASLRKVLEQRPYPESVARQLGEALTAVTLLSATIKFQGSLILQIQGDGALHTLVAQATDKGTLRGLAKWRGEVPRGNLAEVFGQGSLVITIQLPGRQPYQGIVPLEGANLVQALETYFQQSEQLPTRLWLKATRERAAGLLLQELPGGVRIPDAWERLVTLADTLKQEELLGLAPTDLVYSLFNQEQVRLFEADPLAFRCNCSRRRVGTMLSHLGRKELSQLLLEYSRIEVACEFCNRHYSFDAVDIQQLWQPEPAPELGSTRH